MAQVKKNLFEVLYLIEDVQRELKLATTDGERPADLERCPWRLVEAAGLLSELYPESIGVKQPTGRGYKITKE